MSEITNTSKPGGLGYLLRTMFGPGLPTEKPAEIMRWEDDGGPIGAPYEMYEHVWTKPQ